MSKVMRIGEIMEFLILLIVCCCSLGVASITNIHNNSLDNERLQEQSRGLNIFNNTSVLPSMGKKSHFDLTLTSGNVSVLSGNSAFLVCSVVHMGKNVISWIRYNDMNLLSVGKLKNTQDFRISTLQSNSTWTLKIKQVNKKDEGFYQCQISTSPPTGHVIHLRVTEPDIDILDGNKDRFANVGDDLNLTCHVKVDYDGDELKWRHNDAEEINHYSRGGGVFIITEHNVAGIVSHLMIKNLTTADSGQYSCSTSAKVRTSVMLHVLNEELSQAVTLSVGSRIARLDIFFVVLIISIYTM